MLKRAVSALTLCFLSIPAWSQTAAEPAPAPLPAAAAPAAEEAQAVPQTILVSGSRPGPGLWKVSKGEHVMWVFGSYSPVPVKMEWRSREVRNQPELQTLNERALASWVAAAEKALETNASTFAMVHIREILAPTVVIAKLQAKGYTVEPPK